MRLSHLVCFALAILIHVLLWQHGSEFFEGRPAEPTRTALILPLEFSQQPQPEEDPDEAAEDEAEDQAADAPDEQPAPPTPEPEPRPEPEPEAPTAMARDTDPDAELENRIYASQEAGGGPSEPSTAEAEPLQRRIEETTEPDPSDVEQAPTDLTPRPPVREPAEEPAPKPEPIRDPLADRAVASEPVTEPREAPRPAAPRPRPSTARSESPGPAGRGDGIADFPLPPSLLQGPPRAELRFDRQADDFQQNLLSLGGRILVLPRERPRYFLELEQGSASRAVRHTVRDGGYAPRAIALEDIPKFRRLRNRVASDLGMSASRLTIGFELPNALDSAMQESKNRAILAHGLDPSRTRAVVADPTRDPENPLDVRFFLLEDGRRMRAHPNF